MQKHSVDYIYAGFWPRAAAYLIDRLIVAFACIAVRIPALVANMMSGSGSAKVLFDFTVTDIICYVVGALYFAILTWKNGRTVGKSLMRLTVITEQGTKLSFFRALYRETVGRFLTGLACIGYFVAAGDEQKRGFHDRLSDTRVVYAFGKYEMYYRLPNDPRLEKGREDEAAVQIQYSPVAQTTASDATVADTAVTDISADTAGTEVKTESEATSDGIDSDI